MRWALSRWWGWWQCPCHWGLRDVQDLTLAHIHLGAGRHPNGIWNEIIYVEAFCQVLYKWKVAHRLRKPVKMAFITSVSSHFLWPLLPLALRPYYPWKFLLPLSLFWTTQERFWPVPRVLIDFSGSHLGLGSCLISFSEIQYSRILIGESWY